MRPPSAAKPAATSQTASYEYPSSTASPITGPRPSPAHDASDHTLYASPCRAGGATSFISVSAPTVKAASPSPATARAANSASGEPTTVNEHTSAAKATGPPSSSRRRPRRSAIAPSSGCATAATSRAPLVTRPTAMSPPPSGPRTNSGTTGSSDAVAMVISVVYSRSSANTRPTSRPPPRSAPTAVTGAECRRRGIDDAVGPGSTTGLSGAGCRRAAGPRAPPPRPPARSRRRCRPSSA